MNESDRAVTFEIKQLADSYVEEEVRLRATGTFGETMRRSRRGRGGGASDDDGSDGDDGTEEAGVVGLSSDDEDAILGAEAVAFATRTVGLDKALARDDLSFSDPDFTVSPLRGEVAPNGAFEVTVRFHPTHAGERTATLWVETQGREDRLPMQLRGQAVGPLAVFAYDALEVGEIFVGAVHQYEVELVNRGEIECEYRLEPPATEATAEPEQQPSAPRDIGARLLRTLNRLSKEVKLGDVTLTKQLLKLARNEDEAIIRAFEGAFLSDHDFAAGESSDEGFDVDFFLETARAIVKDSADDSDA